MALPNDPSITAIESFLLEYVPQMRAAKIRLEDYDGQTLTMSAPLDVNINDKGTAFGGSLYSLCLMAGWGLTCLISRELGFQGDLVIAHSEIEFVRPLRGELRAQAHKPSDELLQGFKARFEDKGRASLRHQVDVLDDNGELCARYKGKYALVSAS